MTARDRTVVMVLGIVAIVAAFWFLALKPKRADLKGLDASIATAQQRLDAANASASAAEQAKGTYARDYARVARLGKAVPTDDDVPSLVYQLQQAATGAKVDFVSVGSAGGSGTTGSGVAANSLAAVAAVGQAQNATTGAAGPTGASGTSAPPSTSSTPPAQTAAAGAPAGTSVGAAALQTMPFDLQFQGRFFSLEKYFNQIARFTVVKKNGVAVRGRLLTLDSFELSAGTAGKDVNATIHATAYLAPAAQGALANATQASPTGSAAPAQATPAGGTSTSSGTSSPTPTAAVTGAP